jgi:hypothetical protein
MIRGIKASILWGILFITFISWIPTTGNKATYFGDSSSIAGGEARCIVMTVPLGTIQLLFAQNGG